MTQRSHKELTPRNGSHLVCGVVARISGCASQKEVSLDDQVDNAKEEVCHLYPGEVEYRIVSTKGKGEALDRPELAEIEALVRTRELDLLVMEDVGRLVRGTEAVRLWGIAVDHGVRCIAPNDCLDTIDETWEEDLIAACRDHVGHNAHTSKRLKKKLMRRFIRSGAATGLPIAGYVKPEGAKTYYDWYRDEQWSQTIREGFDLLRRTLNCSATADFFNNAGFPTGPYCRKDKWDGAVVRSYFQNRLLAGHPGRGSRHTVKHHETGRRVSVPNTDGEPVFIDCPHLQFIPAVELDALNYALEERNANRGRKPVDGQDPLLRRPRKRTSFPGQFARCRYCDRHYVWGGNGVAGNLMCAGSREYRCWHSIGFPGRLAAERIAGVVARELQALDGFDDQFRAMVAEAGSGQANDLQAAWERLSHDERELQAAEDNLARAVERHGLLEMFERRLSELQAKQQDLAAQRHRLESRRDRELHLPQSVDDLRSEFLVQFERLAVDSPEFGDLLQSVVPEVQVHAVRLLDGGHLLPRATVRLDLAGHVADLERLPDLKDRLSRVLVIDLFEEPPLRERIRADVVRLRGAGLTRQEVRDELPGHPTLPVIDQASRLDRLMAERGLSEPYVLVEEPPEDYRKLRRHENARYRFEPLPGHRPLEA